MRARERSLARTLAGGLLAALLAFTASPAAVAVDEVPVPPPGAGQVAFGMVGLAHLQTARLNVVAVGGGTPDPDAQCQVALGFRDATGEPFVDGRGMPIAAEFTLAPGQAARLDLREGDAFRGRTGLRVAFQASVQALPLYPPNPCVPTLEIFDSLVGRTTVLYPGMAVGGGSPDPSGIPFGMVGLGRLQTARLNVAAVGGGTPDPSELQFCPVEVGFVDDTGGPFLDSSGTPIAARFALDPGEAGALDLRAADAFRGSTALRMAFRAVARVMASLPPSPCQRPVATLEVFDNLTGRTTVLYDNPPAPE